MIIHAEQWAVLPNPANLRREAIFLRWRRLILHDELSLLHRARDLDEAALAEIHDQYYVAIYRYMAFRVNDSQTAEDLTSEVFLRFLRAIRDHHAPQNTIRGWLYGTASRVLKEHYRQKKREKYVELDESLAGQRPLPESLIAHKSDDEALQSALHQLTEEQQNVLALRFGYDLPIKEVAQTMGKTEGSIKMLQARAVMALARILGKR